MSKQTRAAAHFGHGITARRTGRVILLSVMAVLLTVGSAFATAWHDLQTNINQQSIDHLLGTDRPTQKPIDPEDPNAGRALNILVLGSDVREGAEAEEVTGMRADTTMIFHISADRSRVDVLSIPRDTLVDIPSCTVMNSDDPNDTYETGRMNNEMFNAAFMYGGMKGQVGSAAACTWRTVEAMTNIRLDGFVVVDFTSFTGLVDSLDGVPMYFEEDMVDELSGLNIPAGCRLVHGDQALALARARYSLGDGSDISRIGRQQELVTAMIRSIFDMNLLTDIPQLYKVLDVATASITTSEGFGNITNLVGLATSLKYINLDNILFVTMPWVYEGARVRPTAVADTLWYAVANDLPFDTVENQYGQVTDVIVHDPSVTPTTAPAENPVAADPTTATPGASAPTTETTHDAPAQETTAPSAPVCTRDNAVG